MRQVPTQHTSAQRTPHPAAPQRAETPAASRPVPPKGPAAVPVQHRTATTPEHATATPSGQAPHRDEGMPGTQPRARHPHAVPPAPEPPQVHPRVEPTAINGAVPRPVEVPAPRSPEPPAHMPTHAARLATSGPDTVERRYADAELGNSWFATKKPDAPPAGVVLDLDITGFLGGRHVDAAEAPPARDDPRPTEGADQSGNEPEHAGKDWRADADDAAQESVSDAALTVRPLSAADLEAIRWRLDGGTLREVVDDREALRELGDRLDGPLSEDQDNVTRAGLLSVRAEVYRLLGELGMAAAASRLALVHAESSGDVQAIVIAQAELAHVLRLRGDFAEADRLFEEAAGSEAPERLRSVVHENAGRCCFDQGRHMEALDHFARAVRLGPPDDVDLAERVGVCLEAVYIHVLRDGWGPYPRLRREILGPARASRAATPQA